MIERLDAEEVDAARIAPPSSTRIVPQARAQTKSTVSSTHLSVIKQAPQSNGASNCAKIAALEGKRPLEQRAETMSQTLSQTRRKGDKTP